MAHFSTELEGMLNEKYPYLLPALKANDTGTLDDSTRIVGTLCRAHGVPMEEAIDIAAPAHFTHLWRKHRMIYVFDRDLAAELLEQTARSDDGDPIPVEALLHLPYPCISIEAPPFSVVARDSDTRETVFRSDFSGRCMVTATGPEYSLGGKWPTLSVLFETRDERFSHYYLPLPDGGTLTEAYDLLLEFYESVREPGDIEYTRDIAKKEAFPVMAVAQMCLYIQAQNADLQTRPSGQGKQKKRRGAPAKRPPKVVDVGYHIGEEIRSYRVRYESDRAGPAGPSEEKRTVRPHSRRGHWHHFWRNKPEKPDEKELILRWVAPTFIHPDGGDDKPTVVKAKK